MTFARHIPQRGLDLSPLIDTLRQQKDPCFHCTLWDCDQTAKECKFVNTSFRAETVLGRERQELISELVEIGVVDRISRNGVVMYAADETPEERRRRQKREHMRRVRKN